MLKNIFMWFLNNVLKIQTETTEREIDKNQKYANDYRRIDNINFNAIFSNKLASYVISDSTFNIEGNNKRVDLLNKIGQSMWKKMKKITSMGFGYGGVLLVPYSKNGKLYYNIVSQDRLSINRMDGELITSATILAEIKVVTTPISKTTYMRWTDYNVENNNITITQRYTNDKQQVIPTPDFWKDINTTMGFTNVDRCLFGYIKSPINNRISNDKYGVPITFGCDAIIEEIMECLDQIEREYELKQVFVGADKTMFKGENGLPSNGLYKKIDAGDDNFWEIFDPAIRDSAYFSRLQELFKRLEKAIGTSGGILSEIQTQNATATEIKKMLYDTFCICNDMRESIENGLEDFFYACNVLANAYNLSANGDYKLSYDWSYSLVEDNESAYNQIRQGFKDGVIKEEEYRNWLMPSETLEESKKVILEIEDREPNIDKLLNTKNENNESLDK